LYSFIYCHKGKIEIPFLQEWIGTPPQEMTPLANNITPVTQIQEERKIAIKARKAQKIAERANRAPSNRMGKNEKKETARRAFVLEMPPMEQEEDNFVEWRVSTKEHIVFKRPKRKPGHR
jgi:hypothetical protein